MRSSKTISILLLCYGFVVSGVDASDISGTSAATSESNKRIWSPNRHYYLENLYVPLLSSPSKSKSSERARLLIRAPNGEIVATAHVWLVDPKGNTRVDIRGCEEFGWIGNMRVFCQGSLGPRVSIKRIFEAKTGRELQEIGPDVP